MISGCRYLDRKKESYIHTHIYIYIYINYTYMHGATCRKIMPKNYGPDFGYLELVDLTFCEESDLDE
jgi:hypothetical protein